MRHGAKPVQTNNGSQRKAGKSRVWAEGAGVGGNGAPEEGPPQDVNASMGPPCSLSEPRGTSPLYAWGRRRSWRCSLQGCREDTPPPPRRSMRGSPAVLDQEREPSWAQVTGRSPECQAETGSAELQTSVFFPCEMVPVTGLVW